MYSTALLVLVALAPPAPPAAPICSADLPATPGLVIEVPLSVPADTLSAAWERAVGFEAFLPGATERNRLWQVNWDRSRDELAPETIAGVRALVAAESADAGAGSDAVWRLLVVADPGCSDSMSSIPYLARLADEVEGLELRLMRSDEGRPFMDAHPTPDGRGATPTVLLLNPDRRLAGCWVEQPGSLQEWWLGESRELPGRERMQRKMAWYESDAGRETVGDIVRIVEAARRGELICPGVGGS
jgi:hypothetical protein